MVVFGLRRLLASFYKQVHPDVTGHLGCGLREQNSQATAQLNAYLDALENPQRAGGVEAKTLVFHRVDGTPLRLRLRALGARLDAEQAVGDLVCQLARGRGGEVARPPAAPPTARSGRTKKDVMDMLYRQALDVVVGRDCSEHNSPELTTCARLYERGVDPRLIFFKRSLTRKQRDEAIRTLELVSRSVEVPRVVLVFTDERCCDAGGGALRIPCDVDAAALMEMLSSQQ